MVIAGAGDSVNWTGWADFAAMGGYGLYVWGSFGMTALVIVLEVLSLARRRGPTGAPPALPIGMPDHRSAR